MDRDLVLAKAERLRIKEQLRKLWSFRCDMVATTGGFDTYGLYHPERVMERIRGVPSIGVFWEMWNSEIGWFAVPEGSRISFPHDRQAQDEALRSVHHGRSYNDLVEYFRSVGITVQTINERRSGFVRARLKRGGAPR